MNHMWFKVFVLLRIPISAVCLFGYRTALGSLDMSMLGTLLVLGAFVILGAASVGLVRFRRWALSLANSLFVLELVINFSAVF